MTSPRAEAAAPSCAADGPVHGAALGRPLGRPRWWLVVFGYLLALFAGWGYGAALRAGGEWDHGGAWERSLLVSAYVGRPEWLDPFFYAIPWAGTNLTLGPLIALVAVWLVRKKRRDIAIWLVVVELGVLSLNWLVKHLIVRDRPDIFERVGWFGWASYPSGHAMASLAVGTTLAAAVHRATGWRWPLWVALSMFALISYSRLVHGVHWPTDVIGGALVGLVWLVATWFAFIAIPDGRHSA